MSARLDAIAPSHRNDPVAAGVLDECRREIDVFRRHADCYGYAFFVVRKPDRFAACAGA